MQKELLKKQGKANTDIKEIKRLKKKLMESIVANADEAVSGKDKKAEIKLLNDVLQLADLVKFAKWQPLPDECERSFHQVTQFIDQTKEVEISHLS